MPLAGSIVWTLIGIAGAILPPILAVWSLFIGTRLHRLSRNNDLALHRRELSSTRTSRRTSSTASSSTASRWHCSFTRSPSRFFRVDYTSLPLTVGILAGLMWVPALLDHPALGRDLSRRSADGSGDGRIGTYAPHHRFRGHSGGHRGRLQGSRLSSWSSAGAPSAAAPAAAATA